MPEEQKAWMSRPRPIEMRPVIVDDWMNRKPREPFDNVWIRATGPVPDDIIVQQSVLAYASDMSLLDTALLPHGRSWNSPIQMASLDHAMWFHHPFKLDDWLLYAQDSPSSSGAGGFNRGSLYTRDGRLVASVVQEGLMRPREDSREDLAHRSRAFSLNCERRSYGSIYPLSVERADCSEACASIGTPEALERFA
jgi:acyl-CoA thioesterase-2